MLVLIGPIEVLLPFAVRDQTGSGPAGFALVLAAFGVGGAVGSLVVVVAAAAAALPDDDDPAAGAPAPLPMALIGLTDQLWVMAAGGLRGRLRRVRPRMVIWGTLLQRRVPPHLLGRVSSLDFFVSLALMPVSMAVAGPVGEWIGMPTTFVLAGTIPVFLAVAAILGWRLPRRRDRAPAGPGPGRDWCRPARPDAHPVIDRYRALSSSVTSVTDFLASPNSIEVLSS